MQGSPNPAGASMEDVAALAGVSVSTVSRALRGFANVRPETLERVRRAALDLGFSASPSAASLATGKVKRIAVLIGSPLTDWFSGSILDGIYRELRTAGYDLLLYRVHDADERLAFFETLPARRNADALLVASFALDPGEQELVERLGMPVVYLNQRVPGAAGARIDDRAGGAAATRHALALGRSRVVFLREKPLPGFHWSARDRYDGYVEALAESASQSSSTAPSPSSSSSSSPSPSPSPELIEIDRDVPFGQAAAAAAIAGPLPCVVVCESDEAAVPLVLALQGAGVAVPGDVAVIGFDGQPSADLLGITTMVQPVTDMAAWVARTAVALARDPSAPRETLELPTTLRVGRTTAGAAS